MMPYFLDTVDSVVEGVGFAHFGGLHLLWLLFFAVLTAVSCVWYRRLGDGGRSTWKKTMAVLLIADEIFKDAMLLIGGRFSPGYLPFHLCSINIFIIAFHAWKPGKLLNSFLFTVAIPGAIAALLFPTWTALPLGNFMHLHSFTVHILLAMYPIVLAVAGELNPQVRDIPKCLLLLVGMAIPIYGLNLILDTNFMFLMWADEGNPLYLFKRLWGNHLLGFPVIIAGVLLVMYGPIVLIQKFRKKEL